MPRKILVVGGVAGGATVAARLRRVDETASIVVIERGEYISFANCGLPYYIGGVIRNRESLIVQSVEEMTAKFSLDIRTLEEVASIDRANHAVTIRKADGSTYVETYDKLVLSTGAAPVFPPIPGIRDAKNLFTLRTIPDTDAIHAFVETKKPRRAAVIGGGFIGLEMAENLHRLGIDVTIVEMADQVMAPVDYEMAAIVHQHIADQGVTLILKDGVKAFEAEGGRVVLASGRVVETDLVIFAVGVRPENQLAKAAGLALGARGGIVTDARMKTSDPDVYAVGDAAEITDYVGGGRTMIALAGPANKQARIVADDICGIEDRYEGALGTAVAKVFDLTVASTGLNEKALKAQNLPYRALHTHPGSHAGYYPGAETISMKLLFHPETGAIYGAQAVGGEGGCKRIDVIATAIYAKLKVSDLADLDLAYAPPYSSAKDPVNMLGYYGENVLSGLDATYQWHEVPALSEAGAFFLDVREPVEFELGAIPGAVNIPLGSIRERIGELPKDRTIHVYCLSGIRSHSALRILAQNGFAVKNLDGGYKTWQCLYGTCEPAVKAEIEDSGAMKPELVKEVQATMKEADVILKVDACGLQCPGPIVQLYKAMKDMKEGQVLEITATDPGFLKDIGAWAAKTGNTLISAGAEGKVVTAKLQKGAADIAKNKDVAVSESKNGTTIVVFSQDLDKAIAAFIIASGAASMGKKVSLFFTFWGLNILRKPKRVKVKKTFIERMFGFMMPRGVDRLSISNMNMAGMGPMMIKGIMKKKNVESLQSLMANARAMGVKIIACAMSMDIMGIKKEELIDGIEIAGVATYLGDTTEANHNLFI
ncbi:MAG: FAD-dependent oxidoreductase [Candidatus Izemoplasmatales bacterium]